MGEPISSLPIAISLDGSEYYPLVQGGTTKRSQLSTMAAFTARTSGSILYTIPLTGGVQETQTQYNFQRISIRDFGAVGDTVTVTATVTMALGSPALHAAGASFTAADHGKVIYVPGAGAAGAVLATTIVSGTGTDVVLSDNALTAVAAVSKHVVYGHDDTDAINAAISATKNGGYALDIPVSTGDYSHTSTLVWAYNNFNVSCTGEPSFIHTGTGVAHSFNGMAVYPGSQGCVGGVFGGPGRIFLKGNPAGGTTRALYLDNWHFGKMNVAPRDATVAFYGDDTGIVGSSAVCSTFDIRVSNNIDGAFVVQPGTGVYFNKPVASTFNLVVEGCGAGGAMAVDLFGMINCSIRGDTIESNAAGGLRTDSASKRNTYINLDCEDNATTEWVLADARPVLINCTGAVRPSTFNTAGAVLLGGDFQSVTNNDNTFYSINTGFYTAFTNNGTHTTILSPQGDSGVIPLEAATSILENKVINTDNGVTLRIASHLVDAVTGTGSTVVLAAAPTIASPTFSGTVAGAGTIPNSVLANSSITINGSSVSLGGSVTVTAAAASMSVGTTTVLAGTTGRILYDNAGVLGEKTVTGTGSVVLDTAPTFSSSIAVTTNVAAATHNNVAITTPASTATLTIGSAKTVTLSNTLTFTGTDGSSVAFGAGGTVLYNGGPLGTPSSGTASNLTGLPISTGLTGAGTGVLSALAVNVGSAGAPVLFNGAGGTPSSITLTNASGTASSLTAGIASTSTVVDDSATNTTVYPAWWAGTGTRPASISVSKLTFNPGTGLLTATGFSGAGTNLTGTASGLTAGNVTTNANLTGPVTSAGNATSVTANAITYAMMQQAAAFTLPGVAGASTANLASITATDVDQVMRVNAGGTAIGWGNINLAGTNAVGTSILKLANGGTNAALTASNGGIFYSTASAGAILSGTATARQMLQSGASTTPAWSTTTWPATTTINRLLYSSAANVISDLATANSAVLVTDSGGIPSLSTTLPNIALGTPTSINLSNGTSLPISTGVSGLGSNVATFLATPSSANFAAALTDEDGTGVVPFEATGTWTPTDQSGASLTFTSVSCRYTRIGNIVHAYGTFTYPATVSGAAALVGGLPFTVPNASYAAAPGAIKCATNALGPVVAALIINTATFNIWSNGTGAALTNNGCQAAVLNLNISYPIA